MKGPAPSKPDARRQRAGAPTGAPGREGREGREGQRAGEQTTTGDGAGDSTGAVVDSGATGPGAGADTGFWQDPKPTANGTGAGATPPTGAGEVKRGRGRPPGSSTGTGAKKEKVSASLEGIEGILLSLHTIAATVLKVPELSLSEPEAKQLTSAMNRVAAHYDVGASEKTLAWMNLAVCAGGIYGTRLWSYQLRTKSEAEKKLQAQAAPPRAPYPFPVQSSGNAAGAAL